MIPSVKKGLLAIPLIVIVATLVVWRFGGIRHFKVPGELVVSSGISDRILYTNGSESHEVQIRWSGETGHIFKAKVGHDGNTYGISVDNPDSLSLGGKCILRVRSDGSLTKAFVPPGSHILDYDVTDAGLVILGLDDDNRNSKVLWTDYSGGILKEASAPIGAKELAAVSTDGVVVGTWPDPSASLAGYRLFLFDGDRFENLLEGSSAAWINSRQFVYYLPRERKVYLWTVGARRGVEIAGATRYLTVAGVEGRYLVTVFPHGLWGRKQIQVKDLEQNREMRIGPYDSMTTVTWSGLGS